MSRLRVSAGEVCQIAEAPQCHLEVQVVRKLQGPLAAFWRRPLSATGKDRRGSRGNRCAPFGKRERESEAPHFPDRQTDSPL